MNVVTIPVGVHGRTVLCKVPDVILWSLVELNQGISTLSVEMNSTKESVHCQ
jgi:hypothetical protein